MIDVAVAFSRPTRLVRFTLGPFLVIGIGGIAGVLYDAIHIPHYLFQGANVGRQVHLLVLLVSVGLWSVVNALLCGRVIVIAL